MLHILIDDSKGILWVKMYSLSFDVVKMCSNIERCVFRYVSQWGVLFSCEVNCNGFKIRIS